MIKIPAEYLGQMGEYSIKIEGAQVKVKVVHTDSPSIVNTHITKMRSELMRSTGPKVVGVDVKHLNRTDNKPMFSTGVELHSLVLCVGANCLIVCMPPWDRYSPSNDEATQQLMSFLNDSRICFVGSTERPGILRQAASWGVKVGDLAATMLKRPTLITSSLREIAREAGVHYEGPLNGIGEKLKIAAVDPIVFSEDEVKPAVYDAYAYYKIGHELLSSL